jgi:hypothetical protein
LKPGTHPDPAPIGAGFFFRLRTESRKLSAAFRAVRTFIGGPDRNGYPGRRRRLCIQQNESTGSDPILETDRKETERQRRLLQFMLQFDRVYDNIYFE